MAQLRVSRLPGEVLAEENRHGDGEPERPLPVAPRGAEVLATGSCFDSGPRGSATVEPAIKP